jgi:hypothetical protein
MQPSEVAEALIKGLESEEYEIHAGATENVYKDYLSSPLQAFSKRNP